MFAFHSKTIRKLSDEFDAMCMDSLRELIPDKSRDLDKQEQSAATAHLKPLGECLEVCPFLILFVFFPSFLLFHISFEDELNKAADEIRERQLRDKKVLLEQMDGDLSQYEINVDTKALAKVGVT